LQSQKLTIRVKNLSHGVLYTLSEHNALFVLGAL